MKRKKKKNSSDPNNNERNNKQLGRKHRRGLLLCDCVGIRKSYERIRYKSVRILFAAFVMWLRWRARNEHTIIKQRIWNLSRRIFKKKQSNDRLANWNAHERGKYVNICCISKGVRLFLLADSVHIRCERERWWILVSLWLQISTPKLKGKTNQCVNKWPCLHFSILCFATKEFGKSTPIDLFALKITIQWYF